jgi:hypothetical protein
MWIKTPDPTIPWTAYDPDKPNPGVQEMLRQEEFCEEYDFGRAMAVLNHAQGFVFERGEWVKAEPYSQRNWEGDGA